MVVKKEQKEDVFAGFHIEQGVADNEARLNQMVEEEQRKALPLSSESGSAFAEFNLGEIVRKHEERLRQEEIERKASEEDWEESGSIRASSRRVTSSIRGLGQLLRPTAFLSQRAASKDSDDGHSHRHYSSRRGKWDTDRNIAVGDELGSVASTIDLKGYKGRRKTNKHTNTSRSGTTIATTVREEDEYYSGSEAEEIGSVSDVDVEEGENDAAFDGSDDDDDSFIGVREGKKSMPCDVITRSATGMPIGGMLSSNTKEASSSDNPSDYRWISPHKADTIFSDFYIDAIVKDYEKMHRNIAYNVDQNNGGLDNIEEEDENENALGIHVRYRTLKTMWLENFPRTHGILFRIVVPLMLIICASYGLGYALAIMEKGEEIANNNAIIRATHNITEIPQEDLFFVSDGPAACFRHYLRQKIPGYQTPTNMTSLAGLEFPPVSPGINNSDQDELLSEIESYMAVCSNATNDTLTSYMSYKEMEIEAVSQASLTFNWIRCWNTSDPKLGSVNPVAPNKEQLKAAMNQAEFFYESWRINQTALYNQYLIQKNITDQGVWDKDAYERSVENASGEGMCGINAPASAWFWFVFMTTVGYGNVSPVTEDGRLFVASIGCISVILWAVLLYIAGKVLGIIIDDLFRRCNCRSLNGNFSSVVIWGAVSCAWLVLIGEQYMVWSNRRLVPDEFRFSIFGLNRIDSEEDLMTFEDAYWFSYISLLTVGLGDFSIGPESFFIYDMIVWTSSFLIGFTFLSTFLGQLADLTNYILPDTENCLKERLLNTNLVGKKEVQYKRENEKGIERLEKLVEIMDDDDLELITQRVTRIRVKKNLLVHLLHQTKIELEYYKKRGERYDSLSYERVCMEENMLNEVTNNTRKEREKLESYRDGRAHSSEGTTLPTPGSDHSYFDDGTPLDELEKKLKVRKGQKVARKKLKASWYI